MTDPIARLREFAETQANNDRLVLLSIADGWNRLQQDGCSCPEADGMPLYSETCVNSNHVRSAYALKVEALEARVTRLTAALRAITGSTCEYAWNGHCGLNKVVSAAFLALDAPADPEPQG